MEKNYDGSNVLLRLLYFCNQQKEVYFKRADVTEYLINSKIFEIPNKQGFDGNLSYFGYDIKRDIDSDRILLLRGKHLNDKCLLGKLNITKDINQIIVSDDKEIIKEIDLLIANKTYEAKAFSIKKEIIKKYDLIECDFRIYGNKKLYKESNKYYMFPGVLYDCINDLLLYEIVNTENIKYYNPDIIFPLYNYGGKYFKDKIISLQELGELTTDFSYFTYRNNEDMISEIELQNRSNEEIIKLINKRRYNIINKETTKKILNSVRLNASALRALAFNRDKYKCLLCEIQDEKLLVCSHIKPWKTNDGRLDFDNVLTLCTLHDALFDKGYISFDVNGNVQYSNDDIFSDKGIAAFIKNSRNVLNIDMNDNMKNYIKFHLDNIFRKEG
ncbi:MAG: HNH endonuclease [Treponema sp.]|nr:HNH endonuclease [Treponema sp.]